MKPKDNKYHYDSGRLRHRIAIMGDVVTDDGYGGTNVVQQQLLSTWAGKEKVSDYKIASMAGAYAGYEGHQYFIIRNRGGFYPQKTMSINVGAISYNILEVRENDDPCTFLWLLCATTDRPTGLGQPTTPVEPSDELFVGGYLNENGTLNDSQVYDLSSDSQALFLNGYLAETGVLNNLQLYNLT